MTPMGQSYTELFETFRWHVPKGFNLAQACCLQWANQPGHERRPAIIEQSISGTTRMTSFAELAQSSSQLANGLTRLGVIPGDRVIIVLSQPADVMLAMFACWAIRAVAVPLSPDLTADTLLPKFKHARSQVALIDAHTQEQALLAIGRCPRIKHIVGQNVYDGRVMNWRGLLARQPHVYAPNECLPSDPALLVWPHVESPDLPPSAALVMAHQSLIGQLPGFVMASHWFPEAANQLLTTFKPWQDKGLLAAILPALYFGHTVVLADKPPAPANVPRAVTHVVTSSRELIDTLNHDAPHTGTSQPLKAIALLDHTLTPAWRERAKAAFGVIPNLATFVDGCGLIVAQCHERWQEPEASSGRLVPGHRVRLCEAREQSQSDTEHEGQAAARFGQLEVARTDIVSHTDPALFIQAWPVKETLDVNATLPDWWATGLHAKPLAPNQWQVFGHSTEWQNLDSQPISLWEVEQNLLALDDIDWAQVAFMPTRKAAANDLEVWALVDAGTTVDRQLKPWRQALLDRVVQAISQTVPQAGDTLKVRVGIVDYLALPAKDRHSRLPWQTRAYQALVDFL